jgi:hypothetical protein
MKWNTQKVVWEGIHIGNRQDEEHNILCYQIDSFYVEVFYHSEYHVVRKYRPFKNPELLTPSWGR